MEQKSSYSLTHIHEKSKARKQRGPVQQVHQLYCLWTNDTLLSSLPNPCLFLNKVLTFMLLLHRNMTKLSQVPLSTNLLVDHVRIINFTNSSNINHIFPEAMCSWHGMEKSVAFSYLTSQTM